MNAYKYKKIDAFTSGLSLGNPAACVYLDKSQVLTDAQMLSIAKQHKGFVSEVVYCIDMGDSSFDMIYYSSECEVSFCGHGTIACMYSLIKSNPQLQAQREISIRTRKKGNLTIYNKITEQDAIYISAPEPVHFDIPVTVQEIADNLQINISKISKKYPVDFIDAGNRTLIVPIASFDDEISIFPNEQTLKNFTLKNDIDIILIFCMDTEDKTHKAHTRIFAAKYGYLEDPATGSGNAAFGYYMLKNDIWDGNKITIEQGGNDRIFNTIHLCRENGKLLFGGKAAMRIEGVYYI
ncbi:MAG: PhzF family phenazine biosynthesis isomerase [Endomicrobia bacterium]|nr:PhzF family phenazine biosynthesis isomerase [Endomicrobiia bacterium]